MKPSAKSSNPFDCEILALGAHPDDIEFGCGAVVAGTTRAGGAARLIVCSRGESGSRGRAPDRTKEARAGARHLGATLEWLLLDGDGRLEHRAGHAIAVARAIRLRRPRVLLAPSPVETQHPDHARLGRIVRDAMRLARFGGIRELRRLEPHAAEHLLFYAVAPEGEPSTPPLLIDTSDAGVQTAWRAAMAAHASQVSLRPYDGLQIARSELLGLRAGCGHAMALYPDAPLVFPNLMALPLAARHF